MATGTIKKLISDRGFGFITADDGKDYFFHRDGLSASLDFNPKEKNPRSTLAFNAKDVDANGEMGAILDEQRRLVDHDARTGIAERRGRNIARVAAARKLLTLVYYGLRDGEIRCLAPAATG